MIKIKGFTLAEVLITLGVVGVVSAITIPTVINKYQERVTISKVKKIYSTINQAFMLSVKDNGYANEWNVNGSSYSARAIQFMEYLKPYLKILRDCGTSSGCLGYTKKINRLNGQQHQYNYDTSSNYYKFILNDGSYIWILPTSSAYCQYSTGGHTNVCSQIYTDINGGKKPNTIGKDIFIFYITPYAIKPNTDDCNTNEIGWGCSGYILQNGDMDYLKK